MKTALALLFAPRSLAVALCAGGSSSLYAAPPAHKPNILFIYTDDQSHRTVAAYPQSRDFARTPNIDKLADAGIRFESAYIGTWCMPSRASMLTGRQPHAIESMRMEGEYPGSTYDPEQCPFWPKVFREHGYVTAQIGKWHTGTDTGRGRDWDYQIVWNRPNLQHDEIVTPHQAYYHGQMVTYPDGSKKILEEYSTDAYTRWADEFIRGQKGRKAGDGRPWYLWLCYGAVHSPFTPAERHAGSYADCEVPVPGDIYPPREGKPGWVQKGEIWTKNDEGEPELNRRNGKTLQAAVAQYNEGVLALDEGVKALVRALRETGQLKNTMIVFTSDQGYGWGEHGLVAKKAPYDSNIRVPLIVSWPRLIEGGQVCPAPVGGVDLIPTFFRHAGIELPWKMHGHDLTPLFKDAKAKWNHPVMISYQRDQYGSATLNLPERNRGANLPWYVSIRKGPWKYVRYLVDDEMDELYHLGNDPDELKNEVENPNYAKVLAELRAEMKEELKRTEAPFVDILPKTRTEDP